LKFQKLHPLNTLPEVRRLSAISKVHDSADVAQSIVFSEVCEQSLSDNVAVEVSTPVNVSVVTGQFDSADAVGAHSGQSDVFVEVSGQSDSVGIAVELSRFADTVTEVCEQTDAVGKSSGQSDAVDEVCAQSLSDDVDVGEVSEHSSSAEPAIKVLLANNRGGRRKWDKYNYCLYCMQPYPKLSQHFYARHITEPGVKEAFSFAKRSSERKLLLMKLTNQGDFAHNMKVLSTGRGVLIPFRRPTEVVPHTAYLPCDICYGMFKRERLWEHMRSCPLQISTRQHVRRVQSKSSLLLPDTVECSEQMKIRVLEKMNHDEISIPAKNDPLIMKFGTRLFSAVGHEEHTHGYISQKMRELARLLIKAREVVPSVQCLSQLMKPQHFCDDIKAVKCVCGFDEDSHAFRIPSLGLKLGHALKKCALLMKSQGLQSSDDIMVENAEKFIQLCEIEWPCHVSSHALRTLDQRRWNKPKRLPLASDVKLLKDHLQSKLDVNKEALEKTSDSRAWYDLAKVTLVMIMLFNRRRSGEVERIPLKAYELMSNTIDDDVFAHLSEWEKALCKSLNRMEIRGKRGRKVPVLLTNELSQCCRLLVEKRMCAGVCEDNQYLFACPVAGSKNPIRGAACLHTFVKQCSVSNPDDITSTNFRKQIATMSQVLSLRDNELDILADFMGHDVRVHRQYYRLPEDALQVAKVSKVLMAMERGDIAEYYGKNLDEITINAEGLYVDIIISDHFMLFL